MFKQKRGASLVLVVMLMAFVMIVGLGVVAVAGSSSGQTNQALKSRQADFTAQSIINAVTSAIQSGDITPGATTISGSGTDSKLGGYSYTINPDTDTGVPANCYKISVDAYYPINNGTHSKMNSVLQMVQSKFSVIGQSTGYTVVGDTLNGIIKGDMTLNNTGKTLNIGQGSISGNLNLIGNLSVTNGTNFIGTLAGGVAVNTINVTGDVSVSNGTMNANIVSGGNISMSNGGQSNGDFRANKSVNNSNGSVNNIYADGDVTLSNGAVVKKNIYVNGNYSPGGITPGGTVYRGQAPAISVPLTITAAPWPVTQAQRNTMAGNTINVNLGSDQTVSQSGTLKISNQQPNTKLTFDASIQDLYILLKSTSGNTVTIGTDEDVLTKGSHNVYLFLDDGNGNYVNLTVGQTYGNGDFMGNTNVFNGTNTTELPNLYIISTLAANSTISFPSTSSLYGYVYAPYATVYMSGNNYGSLPKLYGAVTASNIGFDSYGTVTYQYIAPNGSGGSGGGVTWNTLGTYVG